MRIASIGDGHAVEDPGGPIFQSAPASIRELEHPACLGEDPRAGSDRWQGSGELEEDHAVPWITASDCRYVLDKWRGKARVENPIAFETPVGVRI